MNITPLIVEYAQRVIRAMWSPLPDPDAPRLSDLVKLFLEENVEDPSIIRVERADWDGYYKGQRDFSTYDVILNNIRIAKVLNSFSIVELRYWSRLGVEEEVNNKQVNAADPELFEKFWAHIAAVDAKIDCPGGWSLISKPKRPPPSCKEDTHKHGYPAFLSGEN